MERIFWEVTKRGVSKRSFSEYSKEWIIDWLRGSGSCGEDDEK